MTPVEACLRRARVIRCAGRITTRRDRLLAGLQTRAYLTDGEIDRLRRELNEHDWRVGLLREHFEVLGEVALRGAARQQCTEEIKDACVHVWILERADGVYAASAARAPLARGRSGGSCGREFEALHVVRL